MGQSLTTRPFGIAASAVLILVAIFLAIQGGDGGDARAVDTAPRRADASDLTGLEGALGHELYWAGQRRPTRLELTEAIDGSAYLRYLPPGIALGDPRPRFLTVGTYPVGNAAAALRHLADKAGTKLERRPDGGLVLVNPSSAGSVYLAYPGSGLQIEVYDPVRGRALGLVRSGAIRPVG